MPTTEETLKALRKRQRELRRKLKEAEDLAGGDSYSRHRETMRERAREESETGREIGPLPAVKDPARRERCGAELRPFCETYFPRRFYLPWSLAHRRVLARTEEVIRVGGQYALAMPRGEGKTTITETAVLWALLYGYRSYALLIAANENPLAAQILRKLKAAIERNPTLADDFPEVCYPVARLERIHQRGRGQLLNGKPTLIGWTANEIVFPTVDGSPSSGSIVQVCGMSGAIRGRSEPGPDGTVPRPDLVLLDDPQTRESAKSAIQTADRLATIRGDVLGLVGPDKTLAVIMPCTVIYSGDMPDQLLDPEKNPDWHGERTKLLIRWPDNRDAWDQYAKEKALKGPEAANRYYAERRAAMDAGALVSWPERIKPGELSAIQGAMNLYFTAPDEFFAEYQNEPRTAAVLGVRELDAETLTRRLSHVPQSMVPRECTRLTAFIDCQARVLYYGILALDEGFGGSLIEYGTLPAQNRPYFEAADPRPSLLELFPGHTDPQRVYAGLRVLVPAILGRSYERHETGSPVAVDRLLIDAGWMTDAVHQFCRESGYAALVYPSKGYATGSNARPMNEWPKRVGERVGWNWRLTQVAGARRGRYVLFDPDAWKSFAADRLTTPPGGGGAVTFHGDRPDAHGLLAAHLTAEASIPVTARGRTFDKWSRRPDRRDNHYLDVLVGCLVAASVQGLRWVETPPAAPGTTTPAAPAAARPARPRGVKLSELYNRRQ